MTTNDFLPDDYEQPSSGNGYMKMKEEGEYKIRIMSKPILGWIDWKDKKPLRFPMDQKPAQPVDPKKPVRHFWAFIVWNYNETCIQILEVTQSTIQSQIRALSKNADWGDPFQYDIKIIRKGTTFDNTEYNTIPIPPKKLADEIREAFRDKPIHLEALFEGGDPFSASEKVTPEPMPF